MSSKTERNPDRLDGAVETALPCQGSLSDNQAVKKTEEIIEMKLAVAAIVALASLNFASAARAAGDADAGKKVFSKCAVCHTAVAGKNGLGPSLFGVVGRPSASVDGFKYSDAMKAANKTWDEATLNTYLTDPKAAVPGNKMAFAGLPNPDDRANVIAYLSTLK